MKISREIQIGALTIIVILGMIWGYKFVIGQNLLKPSRIFYVNYEDVTELAVSAPVKVNGYSIGSVTGIKLNKEDTKLMVVTLQVEDTEIKFPSDTKALLASEGLVGGKYIALKFDENCDGSNCAKDGDFLVAGTLGLLGSMVNGEELESTVGTLTNGISNVLDSIGADSKEGSIHESIRNLQIMTANLANLTNTMDQFMRNSQRNFETTLANVNKITGVIADDRNKISGLLNNLDSITGSLARADLGKTIENSNNAITASTGAINEFKSTLEVTSETMNQLSSVLTEIESGNGSLSKLLNDKQLYTNLEFTSQNLALLLQDIRLNPKRYISVSVFGKGQKEYIPAGEDPAFEGEWEIRKVDNKNNKK
jgi:phospholipid/cholesterol/gamma-HCH transport system substrate-binding protein